MLQDTRDHSSLRIDDMSLAVSFGLSEHTGLDWLLLVDDFGQLVSFTELDELVIIVLYRLVLHTRHVEVSRIVDESLVR